MEKTYFSTMKFLSVQDWEISKYFIGVFCLTIANVYKDYMITHKKHGKNLQT